MTDNEIIKALEGKLPLGIHAIHEAIDLINRQKAEIERLTTIVDDGAEVCHNCHSKYAEKIKQTKAEAVIEFATDVINNILPKYMQGHSEQALKISLAISERVKEKAGES